MFVILGSNLICMAGRGVFIVYLIASAIVNDAETNRLIDNYTCKSQSR